MTTGTPNTHNTPPAEVPLALKLNEGLGAGAEARCCPQCDDGEGVCVFPYYGVAPHTHETSDFNVVTHPSDWIGSTRMLPREQWPANFRPDDDSDECGMYTHCLHCGAPNVRVEAGTSGPHERTSMEHTEQAVGAPLERQVRPHAPGPWTAEPLRLDGHVWITAQTDPEYNEFVLIAKVAPWNAPLIEAAPLLLELMEQLAACHDEPSCPAVVLARDLARRIRGA